MALVASAISGAAHANGGLLSVTGAVDFGGAVTTNGDVVIKGTTPMLTIGDGGAEDTMILFDGNAQDFRIGLDDGTDKLEIGHGNAHGTRAAIIINSDGDVTKIGTDTHTDGQFLQWDNTNGKVVWAAASASEIAADDISEGDAATTITTTTGDITISTQNVGTTFINMSGSAVKVVGPEAASGSLEIHADQGDDAADKWKLAANTGGTFSLSRYSSATMAMPYLTVDPGEGNIMLTGSLLLTGSALTVTAAEAASAVLTLSADQGDEAADSVTFTAADGGVLTIAGAGDMTLDGTADIILSADGGNVKMDDGSDTIFDFDVDNTTMTIHDDQDTGDKFTITVAQHGATTVATVDDDAAAANLTFDVDGDITLDADAGDIFMADGGTTKVNFDMANNVIYPETDNQIALGKSDKRWTNIFTTDLILNNDRGNWTIIEEPTFLSLRDNNTGRRYKLLMEDITDSGEYGPDSEGNL